MPTFQSKYAGAGAGSPAQSGNSAVDTVNMQIRVLNSPTATAQQKAQAANIILAAQRGAGSATGAIQQLLQKNGWAISGNQLIYLATGQPQNTNMGDAGESTTINPGQFGRNKWDQARKAADQVTLRPGAAGGHGSQAMPNAVNANGDGTAGGPGGIPSADPANAGDFNGGDYSGTFFGNVDPAAINDLAASPDMAWGTYLTQGGKGGADLHNTAMSKYGEDEFRAAMGLAPFLNGDNGSPANTLGFADSMMKRGGAGGGQYVDPSKIMNALFQKLGSDPSVANQEMIVDTLRYLQPFMDQTQYRMMLNRIQPAFDQYTTQGLADPTQDMSGMLLDQLQKALMG